MGLFPAFTPRSSKEKRYVGKYGINYAENMQSVSGSAGLA
jgi:hypothetical protein